MIIGPCACPQIPSAEERRLHSTSTGKVSRCVIVLSPKMLYTFSAYTVVILKKISSLLLNRLDEPIPIALALVMGLQHSFAMIGGLITPPLVVIKFAVCGFPFCPELEQYVISASLIASGISSLIQVYQFSIPFSERLFGRKMFIGSGVLAVMVSIIIWLEVGCWMFVSDKSNAHDRNDRPT